MRSLHRITLPWKCDGKPGSLIFKPWVTSWPSCQSFIDCSKFGPIWSKLKFWDGHCFELQFARPLGCWLSSFDLKIMLVWEGLGVRLLVFLWAPSFVCNMWIKPNNTTKLYFKFIRTKNAVLGESAGSHQEMFYCFTELKTDTGIKVRYRERHMWCEHFNFVLMEILMTWLPVLCPPYLLYQWFLPDSIPITNTVPHRA